MKYLKKLLKIQLVRFLIVGTLNTGFSYGIYAGLIYLGLNYITANFISLILGILFSFRTQGTLVFGNRNKYLIFRFSACWLIVFLINIGFISIIIRFGFNAYIAGAIALAPTTIISYLIQKFFVFSNTNPMAQSTISGLK